MALRHGTWVSQETPGIGVTSPLDARLAMAGTLVKDTAGKARSGVFYDGTTNIVSGTAGMSYQIARAVFVQARSVADGAVVFANDGTINVPTDPAPVANSRIDVVYVWHRDFVTDGQNSDPIAGVAQGAASPTPVAPAIPDGAVELARVTVTANATATNGLVIDQTSQFTAAAGGTVMFRSKTQADLWTTAPDGTAGWLLNTRTPILASGGKWASTNKKVRRVVGTASGNLESSASWFNLGPVQTIPAEPFGPNIPYSIRVTGFSNATLSGNTYAIRTRVDGAAPEMGGQAQIAGTGGLSVSAEGRHTITSPNVTHTVAVEVLAVTGTAVVQSGAGISFFIVELERAEAF